ncbi:MAG TPA: family 20 glycosylhydrolase, partial [Acidimicrobiales bacterium]|nr:family 20 glycosylhydrolase [Acidimicrobiales bacterium]
LNVLHLHLTDDQGWRFPVPGWPRLAEIASWRRETLVGHARDPLAVTGGERFDGTPHGGCYEAATLRALDAYARRRHVRLLPEVDLPGHVQAAIAAYPELGSATAPLEVMTTWGISEHVLNCSPLAMEFCSDVIDALCEVFGSELLHLGGDECPTGEWASSAEVRSRAASLGLSGPEELQGWFTGEMARMCAERGRRLVGWDEILDAGTPAEGTVVMSWRDESAGARAARAGVDVVVSPQQRCYLDRYQSDGDDEPLAFGGLTTWQDVAAYDPLPAGLDALQAGHVLGTQLALWSEYLPGPSDVEYMAFPRACVLAEVAWSGPGGGEDEVGRRLGRHLARLDALGVNYRPLEGPRPWQRGGSGARRRVRRVDRAPVGD